MELYMEQSQKQCINQKAIQNIEILQMGIQELETYLKDLAIENPVIDLENSVDDISKEEDRQRKLEWLNSTDCQNRVYYTQDYEDKEQNKWNFDENKGETLAEYVLSQLVVGSRDESDYKILEYMIYSLDSKGYFKESPEDVGVKFDVTPEYVEELLDFIQKLEPAGVGARDLKECLMIQMDRWDIKNCIARAVVKDYLELVAKNQLQTIAKKLKVSMKELQAAIGVIRTLNPKPGNSFSSRETLKYIVPDMTVVKFQGYYQILINDYLYPEIKINSYYKNLLEEDAGKEVKTYVAEKIKQAEWIKECIVQRKSTMFEVAQVIVERQQKFFAKGPGNLMPLKLADIADEIGVHESTVSRALKDKYVQCPWGIYPMNYFLSTAMDRIGAGSQLSAEQIQHMLKEIVKNEDKAKPYSDKVITELLNEKQVKISRRTVTKYREKLGIKDAARRKEFYL